MNGNTDCHQVRLEIAMVEILEAIRKLEQYVKKAIKRGNRGEYMNDKIFEKIAFKFEDVLEMEAKRLQCTMSEKTEKERLEKCLLDIGLMHFGDYIEPTNIVKMLVDEFKKIACESNDFNTNMIAFTSLYNFLKMENIIEKVDDSIILSISEVLNNNEKEYFIELVKALSCPTEDAFIKLLKIDSKMEIAYVCLAVIYMQQILDYRTEQSKKQYEDLAYCFAKLEGNLRMTILYGYRDIDFPSFEMFKSRSLKYYTVCLPYIHVRELSDLEGEYKVTSNKKVTWSEFISNTSYNKNTLCCHQAIVETGKLYDEMGIIISKMGNYANELEQKNAKLYKLQEERHSIIRDFSHTYENMQAIGLKDIANILINSSDNQVKQCGRVILAEYGMKDSLKAEVNLLRLNFEDKQKDIGDLIRKGISTTKKDNSSDIKNVFEDALKICMLRVIYSGNPRGEDKVAKDIYMRIKNKAGSMRKFVEDFENQIVVEGASVREFLKQFDITIEFDADEEWSNIYFEKNKHAEVLIRSIFGELITNSFKYADLDNVIEYSLKVNEGRYGILQSNKVTEIIESDSGVGIQSKGQILKKMNGYQSYYVTSAKDIEESGIFKVLFLLDKKLLEIQEGEYE